MYINALSNAAGIKRTAARQNYRFAAFKGRNEGFDSFEKENAKKKEQQNLLSVLKNLLFFRNFKTEDITGLPVSTQEKVLSGYENYFNASNNIGVLSEEELKQREAQYKIFKQTPEGIRRSKMSDEEIMLQAENTLDDIYKKLQIQKEYRPKLEKAFGPSNVYDGMYIEQTHTIKYNPDSYRMGIMEMEQALMHEAVHCKEALKRTGIPQNRADEIIRNQLLSNIKNGEDLFFLACLLPDGKCMIMEQLYMNENMKSDFAEFAKKHLYHKSSEFNSKFTNFCVNPQLRNNQEMKEIKSLSDELENMLDKYPEFKNNPDGKTNVLEALLLYSLSHNTRYNMFTNTSGTGIGHTQKLPPVKIKELKGEELKEAEKSLLNKMQLVQGNLAMQAFKDNESAYVQYQYTPEEVLCETSGQKYLIEKLNEKQAEMKSNGTLTPEYENYFELHKKIADLEIEQRNTGLEYYKNQKNVNLQALKLVTLDNEKAELLNELLHN